MIGRLNHVAIAVPDLEAAAQVYRGLLGAQVSDATPQPAHGVTTVFVELPNTKIELLHPLGADSPIAKFLASNPSGGIHHVCYEVPEKPEPGMASSAPVRPRILAKFLWTTAISAVIFGAAYALFATGILSFR